MTDQHDDLGRYFKPEPAGTEQSPDYGHGPAGGVYARFIKGSRYAPPSDPWPEIPDAETGNRTCPRCGGYETGLMLASSAGGEVCETCAATEGHAEIERSRPLLGTDDTERVKLASSVILQVLKEALPMASIDTILRATNRLTARLQLPLDQ